MADTAEVQKLRDRLRRYENALGRLLVSGELSDGSVAQVLRVVRSNGVALGVDHEGRISYTTHGLADALGMDRKHGYDVLASWRRRNQGPSYSKAPGGKQCRVRYPVTWVWDWVLANRVETDELGELSSELDDEFGMDWEPTTKLGSEFVEAAHLGRFRSLARTTLERRRAAKLRRAS